MSTKTKRVEKVKEDDLVKKSDDKKDGSGNCKRNNNTTPKKIVVIKDKNKDVNSTSAPPTPAVTHLRMWISKK